MENSATPNLHPMRLGELLDQAIRIYRRNFFTFVGIVALGYIPYSFFQISASVLSVYSTMSMLSNMSELLLSPLYWLSLVGSLFALFIEVIFVEGLCVPVTMSAITKHHFGQPVGILEAYRKFGSTWGRALSAVIMMIILMIGALIWFIVPIVGWFTGIGLVLFLGGVVWHLLPAVVVNEKIGGMDAVSRAWDLARRRFWWLVGFSLLFWLFELLIVIGPSQLLSALTGDWFVNILPFESAQSLSTLVTALSSSLVQLLIFPIQLIAWNLVYFDLRVRTEGFDLNLATMTPTEDISADIASIPAAPHATRWITADEIGKFIIITLVILGICALAIGLTIFLGFGLRNLLGL
jgi:hypothetical protein